MCLKAIVFAAVQAQASSQAELKAVQAELQAATEMLDTMQQMASSSMQGQEDAQKQMDALTAQLQAAIQVVLMIRLSVSAKSDQFTWPPSFIMCCYST